MYNLYYIHIYILYYTYVSFHTDNRLYRVIYSNTIAVLRGQLFFYNFEFMRFGCRLWHVVVIIIEHYFHVTICFHQFNRMIF